MATSWMCYSPTCTTQGSMLTLSSVSAMPVLIQIFSHLSIGLLWHCRMDRGILFSFCKKKRWQYIWRYLYICILFSKIWYNVALGFIHPWQVVKNQIAESSSGILSNLTSYGSVTLCWVQCQGSVTSIAGQVWECADQTKRHAMFVNIMKYGGLWDLPVQMARMSMVHVRSSDMSDKIWVDDCQLMLNSLLTCE